MTRNFLLSVTFFKLGITLIRIGHKKLMPELEKILGKEAVNEINEQFNLNGIKERLESVISSEKKEERVLH